MRRLLAAALLLATANPAAAAAPIDARVRAVADADEIRTLLHAYGRLLDDRDLPAFAMLFSAKGEWIGGLGTARGRDEILAMMRKAFGDVAVGSNRSNFHILTNEIVSVDGDTATAWSRWTFMTAGADGRPSVAMAGRYDDRLVREDGRWRFARRVASTDIGLAPAR